jgi:hypothetical protein
VDEVSLRQYFLKFVRNIVVLPSGSSSPRKMAVWNYKVSYMDVGGEPLGGGMKVVVIFTVWVLGVMAALCLSMTWNREILVTATSLAEHFCFQGAYSLKTKCPRPLLT